MIWLVRLTAGVAIALSGCCLATGIAAAQFLTTIPSEIRITTDADSLKLPGPYAFGIGPVGFQTLPTGFHYVETKPASSSLGWPNFLVISPAAGILPKPGESMTAVWVILNPEVVPSMPAGSYAEGAGFAATGQTAASGGISILLDLKPGPPPALQSVLSAASLQQEISPGEIVSIFGAHLGTAPVTAHYDGAGLYPTDLSHRNVPYPPSYPYPHDGVTFNGIPAPLLYYSQTQINAIVPYGVAGQKSVNIVVTHNGMQSAPFPLPVADTSPGIFTATQNGNGQGAILNGNQTPNSASNPAAKGSAISIFATGTGVLQQTVPDGSILFGGGATCPNSLSSTACKPTASGNAAFPAAPVSLTIGGQPAPLQYVGPSPGSAAALLQVNAFVPDGVSSGPQPVVLTVGQNSNTQQQVTVAVQ
ncbi:MAG: hypothetical protein C5B51_21765 [Terriglobia bacterium]|nr:MAG: hypothetical protein C5B51_21765 [Terriglobia bacterium]